MAAAMPSVLCRAALTTNPMQTPVWVDLSTYARNFASSRGRNFELDRVQTGTASVLLNNQDRRFDPYNAAGPYYLNLLPRRRVEILATWASVQYPVFSGFVDPIGWPQTWSLNGRLAESNLTLTDGFGLLGQAALTVHYDAELSGARVGHILDTVSWSATARNIDAGTAFFAAVNLFNTTALEHLLTAGESENARLFCARNGDVTFQGRPFGTTSILATFGDGGGSELQYSDLVLGTNPIWNDIHLTRTGGVEQVAVDATSQTQFFLSSKTAVGYLQNTDSQMSSLANWWRYLYDQPHERVVSITIQPTRDPTRLWPQVLGREMGDHIMVNRRPPGGGTVISQESVIEGIQHTASNSQWTTVFLLSPAEPTTNFLIIGDALHGIIGTNTVGF